MSCPSLTLRPQSPSSSLVGPFFTDGEAFTARFPLSAKRPSLECRLPTMSPPRLIPGFEYRRGLCSGRRELGWCHVLHEAPGSLTTLLSLSPFYGEEQPWQVSPSISSQYWPREAHRKGSQSL